MSYRPSPEMIETLREKTDLLAAQALRAYHAQSGYVLGFGVGAWMVKAWVWAKHVGADPALAVGKAHYGDLALKFRSNPEWAGWPHIHAVCESLEGLRPNIPPKESPDE